MIVVVTRILIFCFQVNTTESLKKMMDDQYSHMNFVSVPIEEIYSPEFSSDPEFSSLMEAAGGSDDYGSYSIVLWSKN